MQLAGIDAKWWAAGGAVGLLGVWWVRRTASSAATEPPPDETGLSDTTSGDGTAQGVTPSLYGMYNPLTGQFVGAGGTSQVISTNAQWAQNVLTSMTVSFADTYDPATIALAIANYLSGRTLSDTEFNIAETAIQLYGKPPNPPPDPHKATTGGSGQTPVPPLTPRGPVQVPSTRTTGGDLAHERGGGIIKFLPVLPGWKIDKWISDVRKNYNSQFTWAMLLQLNPWWHNARDMKFGKTPADNTFARPMVIRIAQ